MVIVGKSLVFIVVVVGSCRQSRESSLSRAPISRLISQRINLQPSPLITCYHLLSVYTPTCFNIFDPLPVNFYCFNHSSRRYRSNCEAFLPINLILLDAQFILLSPSCVSDRSTWAEQKRNVESYPLYLSTRQLCPNCGLMRPLHK